MLLEVARQIKAATGLLSKQLALLYDLMKQFWQSTFRRTDETSRLEQSPSRTPKH